MFIIDAVDHIPAAFWLMLVCIISVELVVIEYVTREWNDYAKRKYNANKVKEFQLDYLKHCGDDNADCSPDDISKLAQKYDLTEIETYLAVREALDPEFQRRHQKDQESERP